MITLWLIAAASIFAGIISVDRIAVGQFQISRPVVAAALLGILCGCPFEGIIAGLTFELLFLNSLPVGSSIPDQALFPALLAVLMVQTEGGLTTLPAAIVLALPSLYMDRFADRSWRRRNERVFHKAKVFLRLGRADLAERLHIIAIFRAGLYNALAFLFSCAILMPVYILVMDRFKEIPILLSSAGIVPFMIGLAALASSHALKRGWIGFAIGLTFGAVAGLG